MALSFSMLAAPTLEQLQALRLTAMAAAWTAQPQNAELSALSFDERFAPLVDAEWRARENKRRLGVRLGDWTPRGVTREQGHNLLRFQWQEPEPGPPGALLDCTAGDAADPAPPGGRSYP